MSTEPIIKASAILADAKKQVNEVLKTPDHAHVLLGINASLDQHVNRLNALSGQRVLNSAVPQTKPVTRFMGKEIKRPVKIAQKDLSPTDAKKETFRESVANMYAQITTMDSAAVVENNKTPEDILVLRGVAKRAGLADAGDAEISIKYVEQIQAAITEKDKIAAEQAKIDKSLAGSKKAEAAGAKATNEKAKAPAKKAAPKKVATEKAELAAGAEVNKAGSAEASGNKKIHTKK